MNTDIYHYLLTVAKTRNITRAAEMLHISQPALTKALRRQEKELGVTLFDRTTSPLTLTYAGERYLESARKLLDIGNSLREEMKNIASGAKERVRMGITVERGTAFLPLILPDFSREYPEVEVRVMEGTNAFFERAILDNQMDFCVSTLPIASDDIAYEAVNEAPIYLLSSPEHRFARLADLKTNSPQHPQYVSPEELEGERFLSLTPAQGMYRIGQQILEKCLDAQVDLDVYRRRRDAMAKVLRDAGVEFTLPRGAFYFFAKSPVEDECKFVDALLEQRILAVPGRGFGKPGYIRLACCVDEKIILRSAAGFAAAVRGLKK